MVLWKGLSKADTLTNLMLMSSMSVQNQEYMKH